MDLAYAVKQLDLEIKYAEAALSEKKAVREKLYNAVSPQEKALLDEAKDKLNAPPPKK